MPTGAHHSTFVIAAGLCVWLAVDTSWSQQTETGTPGRAPGATVLETGTEAQSLFELGALQAELDEFDTAAATYLRGIERLVVDDGEFSPLLIDPYLGLARVYSRDGLFPEAVTVLEHSQHISQRNFGLFNTEQAAILDELSRVYQAAGDTRSAQEIQRQQLDIGLRRFGEDGLDVIPYYYRLADYYGLSRMRAKEREQYVAVIEIQEDRFDEYSGEFLRPLRELVRLDTLSGRNSSARRRLQEILEFGTGIAALERARSLVALGDWALSRSQQELGLARYRDAYAVLAADNESDVVAFFARPAMINFIPPPSPVDLSQGAYEYAWGTITALFEVSAGGSARNIEIVAATPPGLMNARYRRRLLESYFRPRLVDGEPVATRQVRFTHEFRYFAAEQ